MNKPGELQRRNELINNSIQLFNQNKYKKLINFLEPEIQKYKLYDDPYFLGHLNALLVLSFIATKDSIKVVKYMNNILLLSEHSLQEYTGNFSPLAPDIIETLLERYDDCLSKIPQSLWGKARILLFQKKYKDAESLFRKAIEKDPKDWVALYMYAWLFYYKFEYDEAIKYLNKAIIISPKESIIYQMMASIYQKMADYNTAEKYFLKATEVNNDDSRGFLKLSFLYHALGRGNWGSALKSALMKNPSNSRNLSALADFFVTEKNDYKKAIDIYNKALVVNPLCNMAIRNKSLINPDYSTVRKDLRKAIRQNRYDVFAYYYYIKAIYKIAQDNITQKELVQKWCVSILSNIFDKYCKYAINEKCYLNFFIENNTFNCFKEAIETIKYDKYNLELYLLLSKMYEYVEDFKQSEKWLEEAKKIDPYNFIIPYKQGKLMLNQNEFLMAETFFNEVLKKSKRKDFEIEVLKEYSRYHYNGNKASVKKAIQKLLALPYKKNDFDLLLLVDLAYREGLYSEVKQIIDLIGNNSYVYLIACIFLQSVFMQEGKYDAHKKLIEKIISRNMFTGALDIINIFKEIFDIDELKNIFVNYSFFNDQDFENIIKRDSLRNNKKIRELWFWECTLLSLLAYKNNTKKQQGISHYTTQETLEALLLSSDPEKLLKNNFQGKIHLSTIIPTNDPREGKVFINFLNEYINSNKLIYKKPNDFSILQTSMTLSEDSLTMFRFYGKKEGKEGSGVDIVFKDSYFTKTSKSLFSRKQNKATIKEDENNSRKAFSVADKKPLYQILYYDNKNKYFIFNPVSKYISKIIKIEPTVTKKKWKKIKDSICYAGCGMECKKELLCEPINNYYDDLINNIQIAIQKIIDIVNDILNQNDENLLNCVQDLLCYIKFLFKDAAFADEQELRLLSLGEMGNKKINSHNRKLYEDYFPITYFGYNFITKIILGPNVENVDVVVEYYKHISALCEKNILIEKSESPFSTGDNLYI